MEVPPELHAGESGPSRESLVAFLLEVRSFADEFLSIKASLADGTEEEVSVRAYALGAVGLARELALGVARETREGAPANAMRLARHLFEADLDLHYLVENPEAAIRQAEAWEARSHLDIDAKVAELPPLSAEAKKVLKTRVKAAYRLDGKAKDEEKAGNEVAATDRGFPTYEHKARAVGRGEDYGFFYGIASLMSHPSVTSIGHHLASDEGGAALSLRASGSDPTLTNMAPALALDSLVKVMDHANKALGPIPGFEERVGAVLRREFPEGPS